MPYRDGEGCWFSSDSQLRIQEDDRVGSLINKMMVNNSVNVAGQGSVLSFICLYHRLFRFRILILNAFCVIAISLVCFSFLFCRILGRATFTGNHQWIVLNNFVKDAYPPEVRSFDD
jgi:hypothetical protein